jgi:hypothetical protein
VISRQPLALLVCWTTLANAGLHGQEPSASYGAGVKAGLSAFDLNGTGTAFVGGPIGYAVLNKHLLVELGVPLFEHSRDVSAGGLTGSERTRLFLPELSLEGQVQLGRFQPYLAVGGGAAIRLNGPTRGGGTLHAALGTRAAVGRHTLLRGEIRARSIRPWSGDAVDFTLGIEWTRE